MLTWMIFHRNVQRECVYRAQCWIDVKIPLKACGTSNRLVLTKGLVNAKKSENYIHIFHIPRVTCDVQKRRISLYHSPFKVWKLQSFFFSEILQDYRLREMFKPSMAELGLCMYQLEMCVQVCEMFCKKYFIFHSCPLYPLPLSLFYH